MKQGKTYGTDEKALEEYRGILTGCVKRNLPLIAALQLEIEDVKQDLSIRLLRALGRYDEGRCRSISQFIWSELQYEILDMKRRHKPHGMTGVPNGVRVEAVSLDHPLEDGSFIEPPQDDENSLILHDLAELLTGEEFAVLLRKASGHPIKKKKERALLERVRAAAAEYFPERMCEYAKL